MEKDFFDILENLKTKKVFEFLNDMKTRKILYKFLAYSLANFKNIKDNYKWEEFIELKSHTILIYLGSIIEAVLYYYIDEKLKNNDKKRKKYLKIKEFQEKQKLKIWTDEDFSICKVIEKELTLNDTINFNALINWAKDNKLIDEKIIKKIHNVRKVRNSIHINVYKSWELIKFDDLKNILIDTKEIIDYIDNNL